MNETRPLSHFRSLHRFSIPGSVINEDGAGLYGRCAWIVDGATGVLGKQLTTGATDAAWLAGTICERLQEILQTVPSPDDVLDRLEEGVRDAFVREAAESVLSGDHAPSACLGLVRIRGAMDEGHVLEGRFLGDVVALIPTETRIVRWTDERSKPFERRTLAALQAADRRAGEVPEAVRRQILENRTKLNRPEGYWVVNPLRPWAGHELRFEAVVAPGRPVVLATDGFMRLVDVFGAYTDESLHTRLAAGEGEGLMRELRDLERSDPAAEAHPRVKIHDDATVLVIAAEMYG